MALEARPKIQLQILLQSACTSVPSHIWLKYRRMWRKTPINIGPIHMDSWKLVDTHKHLYSPKMLWIPLSRSASRNDRFHLLDHLHALQTSWPHQQFYQTSLREILDKTIQESGLREQGHVNDHSVSQMGIYIDVMQFSRPRVCVIIVASLAEGQSLMEWLDRHVKEPHEMSIALGAWL